MESHHHHHQILGENKKEAVKQKMNEDVETQSKQHLQLNNNPPSSSSSSSSPSHEFSFTISLETKIHDKNTKSTPPNPSFAIDLTPADEIFFHGHLLPLHLLSHHHHHHHLPAVSPRSSTNSIDSFTLPIKELLPDNNTSSSKRFDHEYNDYYFDNDNRLQEKRGKSKSNFSLFGISNWRKGYHDQKREKEHEYQYQYQYQYQEKRTKLKLDLSRVVKRYMRLVKPLLSFRTSSRGGNDHHQILGQSYSLSGNLLVKNKKSELKGRRGEYSSAPVTMRNNSPTNSGHLVPTGTLSPTTTTTDSTMEELQAAIQAAIAHCKKSIATEDKMDLS